MSYLRQILRKISFIVLIIGGVGMTISMLLGVADIIGTNFLGAPIPGALEITESTMVLIVFGGLCYSQIERAHIRVEIFHNLAGPKLQSIMDIFASLMALIFFSLIFWSGVEEAQFSWKISEAAVGLIRVPLWPARCVLVMGTALIFLQLLLDLYDDIHGLVFGKPAAQQTPPV